MRWTLQNQHFLFVLYWFFEEEKYVFNMKPKKQRTATTRIKSCTNMSRLENFQQFLMKWKNCLLGLEYSRKSSPMMTFASVLLFIYFMFWANYYLYSLFALPIWLTTLTRIVYLATNVISFVLIFFPPELSHFLNM